MPIFQSFTTTSHHRDNSSHFYWQYIAQCIQVLAFSQPQDLGDTIILRSKFIASKSKQKTSIKLKTQWFLYKRIGNSCNKIRQQKDIEPLNTRAALRLYSPLLRSNTSIYMNKVIQYSQCQHYYLL